MNSFLFRQSNRNKKTSRCRVRIWFKTIFRNYDKGWKRLVNYIIGGIICLLFAYLVGVKKLLVLLINYNDFTFLGDKEKLSKRMGIILFIIGVFTIFMPLLLMVFGVFLIKSIYIAIIIALVLLASLFIVVPYFQIK